MTINIFTLVGQIVLKMSAHIGAYCLFVFEIFQTICTKPLKIQKFFVQLEQIGVHSFFISVLTGTFAGASLTVASGCSMVPFTTFPFTAGLPAEETDDFALRRETRLAIKSRKPRNKCRFLL